MGLVRAAETAFAIGGILLSCYALYVEERVAEVRDVWQSASSSEPPSEKATRGRIRSSRPCAILARR
eukprot:scaffold140_cov247-Pinguiococcus_pyrenoidosus.AAC.10